EAGAEGVAGDPHRPGVEVVPGQEAGHEGEQGAGATDAIGLAETVEHDASPRFGPADATWGGVVGPIGWYVANACMSTAQELCRRTARTGGRVSPRGPRPRRRALPPRHPAGGGGVPPGVAAAVAAGRPPPGPDHRRQRRRSDAG